VERPDSRNVVIVSIKQVSKGKRWEWVGLKLSLLASGFLGMNGGGIGGQTVRVVIRDVILIRSLNVGFRF
jgi:hypothetical protein